MIFGSANPINAVIKKRQCAAYRYMKNVKLFNASMVHVSWIMM